MALGVGVAAVNDVCARPAGVVSRPLALMQGPRYWAVRRADTAARPDVELMWRQIEASAA